MADSIKVSFRSFLIYEISLWYIGRNNIGRPNFRLKSVTWAVVTLVNNKHHLEATKEKKIQQSLSLRTHLKVGNPKLRCHFKGKGFLEFNLACFRFIVIEELKKFCVLENIRASELNSLEVTYAKWIPQFLSAIRFTFETWLPQQVYLSFLSNQNQLLSNSDHSVQTLDNLLYFLKNLFVG